MKNVRAKKLSERSLNPSNKQRDAGRTPGGKTSVIRSGVPAAALLVLIVAIALSVSSQSNPDLQALFRQNIGPSKDQIAAIHGASFQAVLKHARR